MESTRLARACNIQHSTPATNHNHHTFNSKNKENTTTRHTANATPTTKQIELEEHPGQLESPPNSDLMTRSSRIRKPSQKAREIAEAALLLSSKTTPSSSGDQSKNSSKSARRSNQSSARNQSSSVRAKVKIGRKKGRATINSNGDVEVEEEAAKVGKRNPRTSTKKRPQQQEDEDDDDDDDQATQHSNDTETEENPDKLYCICLGHDDHTPMIQCEGCDNWFHFSCINLDATEAQEIEAFYCQVCNATGDGITRKIGEEDPTAPPEQPSSIPLTSNTSNQTSENLPDATDKCEDNTPGDCSVEKVPRLPSPDPDPEPAGLEPEETPPVPASGEVVEKILCDSNNDSQPADPIRPSVGSTTQPSQSTKTTRRKQRLAEGLSSGGETSDEDFTGEESLRKVDRKRKTPTSIDSRPSTQPRISTGTPSSTTPSTPTTPVSGVEKTRKACTEQFYKLFEPVFSKNVKQDEDAAMRFSEAVESELYESFGELDARNQKAPRRQYMTKLRSLLFNLKNNPTFLNSLSSLELSPKLIVFMSNEDLQTPEQKALAEQVRQRSLHDSVKTLEPILEPITSPAQTDEPFIGSFPPPKAAETRLAVDQPATPIDHKPIELDQSQQNPPSSSVPPPAQVPISQPQDQPPQAEPEPPVVSQPGANADLDRPVEESQSSPSAPSQPEKSATKCLTPNLLSSFDLEKVFAAIRSVPPPQTASGTQSTAKSQTAEGEVQKEAKDGDSDDGMDLENTPERELPVGDGSGTVKADAEEKNLPDDYDPFVVANGVDADLEAILHGDQASGSQIRPNGGPPPIKEPETQPAGSAQTQPSVWTGNVMTVDAGGFAACAIQVGGRPLSPDGVTWSKLIPTDTMAVVGRLPVKDSTNYLVQSHFAPSREVVLLELKPNLNGPPELPNPERVLQHQQNLIEFFTKKGRHAVVAVNDKVKQAVRDIYLVPVLRQDPLPEFVQLLDDVSIPESTPRARDMMLAVMVLSKGAIPSVWKPPSNIVDPSTSSVSAPTPQAQIAPPPTSSTQNMVGAAQLLSSAPNHGRSPIPVTSSYSLPARQNPTSSAPIDPIPLLQSLSSKISSVSSQLAFPLLSQLPPAAPTNAGPPPGFVPYVQPQQPSLPSVPSSSSVPSLNGLDLSKVDVSALQALLSQQQAFKPIVNHTQQPAPIQSVQPTAPPPSSAMNQMMPQPNLGSEPRPNTGRHPGLPAPPRPANLPLNPHFAHQTAAPSISDPSSLSPARHPHHYPQQQQQQQHQQQQPGGWPSADPPKRANEPFIHPSREKQHRKGLMRMGEVIRSSLPAPHDPRRRSSSSSSSHHNPHHHPIPPTSPPSFLNHNHHSTGRPKRTSQEFVAPPRDGGWAGRGRGRKMA
ncbi:hypothetical protein PTTG_26495 [Puccinia triticina 1-1 BBBD Race 1]|uniref:Transcription factor BYE1 n=1 Tax=Puccinia triticina (isolate 1-1 / race 1 (BBBD)) TaxID=630390 RepID=A0A180GUE7_PUCT1|nr:hypothetical protein PTTG_26495 [Puccinia triticina 1-1 BBBD Race 1]